MGFLIHWPQGHPLAFTLILFVLAALVSIFSGDIRSFFRRLPHRIRTFRAISAEDSLKLLESLHENSYNLLLFIAHRVFSILFAALVFFFVVSSFRYVVLHLTDDSRLYTICFGMFAGE